MGEHADEEYVAAIHETIWRLVGVDVASGGNVAASQALPALASARRRLAPVARAAGAHARRRELDLCAAVAELAELTGWLLCDANRHREAISANRFSLALARHCGHRSIELFVLHNMSLHATYLRRPREAFDLIRPVLDGWRLTARLGAMFQLRLARAHAQMGLRAEAFRALGRATSLLMDGTCDQDPAWAWWVSGNGFHFATGAMHGTLGEWAAAIGPLERALADTPIDAPRDRFLHLCVLLHAAIEVRAASEADAIALELAPLIGTVGSDRPLARLAATIDVAIVEATPARRSSRRLRDAIEPVRDAMRRLTPAA